MELREPVIYIDYLKERNKRKGTNPKNEKRIKKEKAPREN